MKKIKDKKRILYKKTEFSEAVSGALDKSRIMKDVEMFCRLDRYTGSRDGEEAAERIAERMEELGIPVEREKYQVYRSLPGAAYLRVLEDGTGEAVPLTPYVYSGTAKDLEAELVFDRTSAAGGCSQREQRARMAGFSGKLVLTYENSFSFACEAKRAGALGVLTIWHADLAHHGTLGGVWGTPEPEDLAWHYPGIPFAEIGKNAGESLQKRLGSGPLTVRLSIEMCQGIVSSTMPVARIQGRSEKFVLVSGHYDSWYEGATDNGVANAAMMELARVFQENRERLERSLVLAWWSGHSDGRYAGSAWYYDHHWEELKENCVAHINMDICGCKGSDVVGFQTSMLEGADFDREFLKGFNEGEPDPPVSMTRFADQTFWGADIPFAIMPKFIKKDHEMFYWWHTREDTFDKVDPEVALRDTRVIGELAAFFANCGKLPADMSGFVDFMESRLRAIEERLGGDFDLSPVWPVLGRLREAVMDLEASMEDQENTDDAILETAGELARITYTASSPYHQDPAVKAPVFSGLAMAEGLTRENTEEEYYLAVQTRFVRQRNRLTGQMKQVLEICRRWTARWENQEGNM